LISTPLTFIINHSLLEGEVPSAWKKAKIIPVHKKASKREKSNYRPVCILPAFSKVLESVVKSQLSSQLEAIGVLPKTQHGFRVDHSATTAMAMFEHDVKRALGQGKKAGALYLDLSAAFDMIDASIITERLQIYGASQRVCSWTKSYLTERWQSVHYQDEDSRTIENSVGAPQGSVIGPLLFLILVADMDNSILDLTGVRIISYADDTTLIAFAETEEQVRALLEEGASRILHYMKDSGLAANPEKTHFTMFSKTNQAPIRVGKALIPESNSEKLVGFTISKDFSWKPHVEELEKNLRSRIGILKRLTWHLPRETLLHCINPVFTSKLVTGLQLFTDPIAHTDSSQNNCAVLQRLQVLQNKAMRSVLQVRVSEKIPEQELLQRCRQSSVTCLALRATYNQSWAILSSQERRQMFGISERLSSWKGVRVTRQTYSDTFPEQSAKNSLLSRLAKCWNNMPTDIKNLQVKSAVKAKIKQLIK